MQETLVWCISYTSFINFIFWVWFFLFYKWVCFKHAQKNLKFIVPKLSVSGRRHENNHLQGLAFVELNFLVQDILDDSSLDEIFEREGNNLWSQQPIRAVKLIFCKTYTIGLLFVKVETIIRISNIDSNLSKKCLVLCLTELAVGGKMNMVFIYKKKGKVKSAESKSIRKTNMCQVIDYPKSSSIRRA